MNTSFSEEDPPMPERKDAQSEGQAAQRGRQTLGDLEEALRNARKEDDQ